MNKCILIILFILFAGTPVAYAEKREAISDLTSEVLSRDRSIDVTGEWEFLWGKYVAAESKETFLRLGKQLSWANVIGEELPAFGYGTYRTTIKLPKRDDLELALTFRRVKTDYAVYIDGKLVHYMGRLKDYNFPLTGQDNLTGIVRFKPAAGSDEVKVIVHVSNNSYYRGGLDQPPVLSYASVADDDRAFSIMSASFAAGGLLFMGLYHFGLWLKRRSNKTSLYFSILAIVVGTRVFFTYKLVYLFFPGFTEEWMLRCEIALAFTALPFLHIFISSVFPEESNKRLTRLSWAVWITAMCITFATNLRVMGIALAPFQIYFVVTLFHMIYMGAVATKNHREGSILFFAGFIVALITGVHDVLFYNNTIYGVGKPIFPFGVVIFVFIQFVLHSMRFSRAYRDLEQLKTTLEFQVLDRTKALSKSLTETTLLSNAMTNALEDERRSIARELHDDFGQSIRASCFFAETIAKDLKGQSNPALQPQIDSAHQIGVTLMDVYNKNRNLTRRLHPEIIDTLGLKAAIDDLLDTYKRHSFKIDFDCSGDISKLAGKAKLSVFRLLQESLTNIVKHADPDNVRVRLAEKESYFLFSITDDGKGFDINSPKGIGLISMRERMTEIGGNLEVKSEQGKGTSIMATIPKGKKDE